MGRSNKWVKSLMGLKKPEKVAQEKVGRNSKKWKLWRTCSSGDLGSAWKGFKRNHHGSAASEGSDSSVTTDAYTAAVAAVVRAPPKDFRVVRQEWAAIRIQTAFRGFLARRALRALKAVVRLQALFRGRQVRKQAAMTLRCMQALVRLQARIRAHRVRMSVEGQTLQNMLNERRSKADLLKQAEEGWCDSRGTLEEVKAKLQMRQEGAFKRERALAYTLAQKQLGTNQNTDLRNSRTNISLSSLKGQEFENNIWGWSWLERWMAAKPWENRLMENVHANPQEKTPLSKNCVHSTSGSSHSKSLELCSVKVRRNNVTTRISARPPLVGHVSRASSSPSSEFRYDDSSSICTSTLVSGNTFVDSDRADTNENRPKYMNITESTKAKQRNSNQRGQRQCNQWRIHMGGSGPLPPVRFET